MRPLSVLGVPSSVGSHNAGQELAPAALRDAGLVDRLRSAGLDVDDAGDLEVRPLVPAPMVDGVRSADRVATVLREVIDALEPVLAAGRAPVVLGGDCTITLGVVAAARRHRDVGLLYVDGDADLGTPRTLDSGILDTMGVSHLLGDGSPTVMAAWGGGSLLPPERLALLGFDPAELDEQQWTRLVERGISAHHAPEVRRDPASATSSALADLHREAPDVVVHCDVDILDTGAFPLANFPHFNGLALDELASCLSTACADPGLAGLVLTEVNPTHDPDGSLVGRLLDVVVGALAQATS